VACTRFRGHSPKLSRLPFELHWAHVTDRGVSALGIVEALNVVEHIDFGCVPRSIHFARCPFGLERREEAHRIGTVMPLVAGGDEHIYAYDIRTGVARILVGLPFALGRLIEAISRSHSSKSTRPCR
jgi:hypothetical protein